MKPRPLPSFQDITVTDWLKGHQERVYARTANFTFSLTLDGISVVRVDRYRDPVRIPAYRFMTLLPAHHTKLADYLSRWQEPLDKKTPIVWDDAVLAEPVAVEVAS